MWDYISSSIENIKTLRIDSLPFVGKIIKSYVFNPPKTSDDKIMGLNNIEGNKLFMIDEISTLEIRPKVELMNKIVIFSHGNSTDVYKFYPYLDWFSNYFGVKMICYDYPGYGLTKGESNEENCYVALQKVANYYIQNYGKDKITLIGRSLGTGVVLDYCAKNDWENPIILISPYKSIPRILLDWNFMDYIFSDNIFSSISKIQNIKCPVKIFHGTEDEIIPVQHGKDIYVNLNNKKFDPVWIEGANHTIVIQIISEEDIIEVLKI